MESKAWLGLSLCLLGNAFIAIGMSIVKVSHTRLSTEYHYQHRRTSSKLSSERLTLLRPRSSSRGGARRKARTDKAFLRSRTWWLGQLFLGLGELGNFTAYGLLPANIVTVCGSTALLAQAIISPCFLGEPFHRVDLIGIGFILLGVSNVVFSSQPSKPLLPHDVIVALASRPLQLYAVFSITTMVVLGTLSRSRKYGDRYLLIDISLSALAGSFTVLSTKSFSSFLNTIFLRTFRNWIVYPVLAVLGLSAVVQVNFINKALQRFEARVVVPAQFMLFSLSAIFASALTFREFEHVSDEALLNFGLGFMLAVLGVSILTRDIQHSSPLDSLPPTFPSPFDISSLSGDHRGRDGEGQEGQDGEEEEASVGSMAAPMSPRGRPLRSRASNGSLRPRTVSSLTLGAGTYLLLREDEPGEDDDEEDDENNEARAGTEEDEDLRRSRRP